MGLPHMLRYVQPESRTQGGQCCLILNSNGSATDAEMCDCHAGSQAAMDEITVKSRAAVAHFQRVSTPDPRSQQGARPADA